MDAAFRLAPRHLLRYWSATRPYSFSAALVPTFIGIAVARLLFPSHPMQWLHLVLVGTGAVAIQVVSNVVNDIYDARSGLDNPENEGRLNAIVSGLIGLREARSIVLGASLLSLAIGTYFVLVLGLPMLGLVVAGSILAFGYTAPPLKLKYRALGDLTVLMGFGFGISLGAYMVQGAGQPGVLSGRSLAILSLYGLPSALLVVGILHVNNHRDRVHDRAFEARTLGNLLSSQASKSLLLGLLISPYLIVVLAVLLRMATPLWLLTLLSIPGLVSILREIKADRFGGPLVPQVAKLQGLFGVLTVIGIKIATLL